MGKSLRHTKEIIEERIHNLHPNAKILGVNYVNGKTKIELICENGHHFEQRYDHISKGGWCAACAGKKKLSNDELIISVKDKHPNAQVLNIKRINKKIIISLICKNGHYSERRYDGISRGNWCAECYGNKKYNIEYIRDFIEDKHPGSYLLSKEYVNNLGKLKLVCEYNHKFESSYHLIRQNNWCSKCLYKNEQKCREIIEECTGYEFPKKRPEWLNGLELDGYCEDLNIAFEYNGKQHYEYSPKHFHRTGVGRFIEQHVSDKVKQLKCKEKGINLITIPYYIKCKKSYIINIIHSLV